MLGYTDIFGSIREEYCGHQSLGLAPLEVRLWLHKDQALTLMQNALLDPEDCSM